MTKHAKLPTLAFLLLTTGRSHGFLPPSTTMTSLPLPPSRTSTPHHIRSHRNSTPTRPRRIRRHGKSSSTSLYFLGTDGGILGVGAPEVAVTLAVGYFILGPSELYKLVKEIGKFVQNFRTLGAEATKSFEATMENQLELTELRKAQRELNEAFSFRRSINTDEYAEAFDESLLSRGGNEGVGGVGVAAATTTAATGETRENESEDGTTRKRKRKLVRRKKKAAVAAEEESTPSSGLLTEYPDLDLLDQESPSAAVSNDEEATLREQRLERLGGTSASEPDWFIASEQDVASAILDDAQTSPPSPLETLESNRFQSQLSAEEWNAQIMANQDKLSPLAMVMKRLAILEEEKQAADRRLEEEYQRRMDNEDRYYLEKRKVLEEAIGEIQEGVYGGAVEKSGGKGEGSKFR